jgi:hypothetical protein
VSENLHLLLIVAIAITLLAPDSSLLPSFPICLSLPSGFNSFLCAE